MLMRGSHSGCTTFGPVMRRFLFRLLRWDMGAFDYEDFGTRGREGPAVVGRGTDAKRIFSPDPQELRGGLQEVPVVGGGCPDLPPPVH